MNKEEIILHFSLLLASIGCILFCFGLFSEYHFFVLIGIFICCVAMFLEDVFLSKK